MGMVVVWGIAGAMLGSVANALIYRLPKKMSWVKGRSICPKCKHELGFWDLVPLLSFVILGGKCRYCKKPIGWRYFWVELLMAVGFVVLQNVSLAAILWVTVIIAVMDWETRLVSDAMVVVWGVLAVVSNLGSLSDLRYLAGAAAGVIIIGGIWLVSKGRAMGDGDIGIAAVIGLWLGWPKSAVGLWLAFVIGAIAGFGMMLWGGKKLKSQIAFGPFLVIGAWIAYAWGDMIWRYVVGF